MRIRNFLQENINIYNLQRRGKNVRGKGRSGKERWTIWILKLKKKGEKDEMRLEYNYLKSSCGF